MPKAIPPDRADYVRSVPKTEVWRDLDMAIIGALAGGASHVEVWAGEYRRIVTPDDDQGRVDAAMAAAALVAAGCRACITVCRDGGPDLWSRFLLLEVQPADRHSAAVFAPRRWVDQTWPAPRRKRR